MIEQSLTGYLPEKLKNAYLQRHVHPCVHCSIMAKPWRQPQGLSIEDRLKKTWHTHNGIRPSLKKRRNTAVYDNADGP